MENGPSMTSQHQNHMLHMLKVEKFPMLAVSPLITSRICFKTTKGPHFKYLDNYTFYAHCHGGRSILHLSPYQAPVCYRLDLVLLDSPGGTSICLFTRPTSARCKWQPRSSPQEGRSYWRWSDRCFVRCALRGSWIRCADIRGQRERPWPGWNLECKAALPLNVIN
jgi:hypothetical protein